MRSFIMAAVGWLAAMALLSQAGPIGRFPMLFVPGYILGFGFMALAVRTVPRQWSGRRVIAAAVLLGLIGRFFFFIFFPAGNDVYRYIWEGFVQLQGFNPYLMAPDHPALSHLIDGEMAAIWPLINHKDLSAVYPPLTMLLFKGLTALWPSPTCIKTAMLCFDLITLAMLAVMIRGRGGTGAGLFWYALNPLVLVYGAGEAHLDIVQATLLVAGLAAVCANKPFAGFLAMGAAAVSKYFSAVALPFVMQRANRRAWPAAAIALLLFIPFTDDLGAVFGSLFVFGTEMHYNDGLADILRYFTGPAALPLLALFLLGMLAAIYVFEHDRLRSVYLAVGAVLICLPTLHPWYLLLIAPFMVLYPSRAWLVLMAAMVVTVPVLVQEAATGVFQEIKWLKWFAYGPFFGLLLIDWLRPPPRQTRMPFPPPRTVSVVMPVLNEGAYIQQSLDVTAAEPEVIEIVVVDGGSRDDTAALARQAGATVLAGPLGRGCQVAAGVRYAAGDVVLVLHADTRLVPGAVGRMLADLTQAPSLPGGAFEMVFDSPSRKLKWVARLNNWRACLGGIAFGDQGQFVRRVALEPIGGFPAMKLMEDVELSLRLKRFGRPLLVRRGVRVSPRRWNERNFSGNVWKVVSLCLRYLAERRFNGPKSIRTDYYGTYYGKP